MVVLVTVLLWWPGQLYEEARVRSLWGGGGLESHQWGSAAGAPSLKVLRREIHSY